MLVILSRPIPLSSSLMSALYIWNSSVLSGISLYTRVSLLPTHPDTRMQESLKGLESFACNSSHHLLSLSLLHHLSFALVLRHLPFVDIATLLNVTIVCPELPLPKACLMSGVLFHQYTSSRTSKFLPFLCSNPVDYTAPFFLTVTFYKIHSPLNPVLYIQNPI